MFITYCYDLLLYIYSFTVCYFKHLFYLVYMSLSFHFLLDKVLTLNRKIVCTQGINLMLKLHELTVDKKLFVDTLLLILINLVKVFLFLMQFPFKSFFIIIFIKTSLKCNNQDWAHFTLLYERVQLRAF